MSHVVSLPHRRLLDVLSTMPHRVIACSGGMDSLVLSAVAAEQKPATTVIAHSQTPAVPVADTTRVESTARERGWELRLIRSGEFEDERYLQNPVNRCYFCKSHLYEALEKLTTGLATDGAVILSGANTDDLGEFRPGLKAAFEHDVRHPFIEADLGKDEIRQIAAELDLDWAELPASPCLASRLYTGTEVTPARLAAVAAGESTIRQMAGVVVVRCRVRADQVFVEVLEQDRDRITADVLTDAFAVMRAEEPGLRDIALDDAPYRPGRSFVETPVRRRA